MAERLQAEIAEGFLALTTGTARRRRLHPLWLRERCPCPECRDPRTGQRLVDAWALPLDTGLAAVDGDDGGLRVTFRDGHVALFTLAELQAALSPPDERDDLVLWDAAAPAAPETDWRDAARDDLVLYEMLENLRRYGFALVRHVPLEPDAVADVAERIGPLRRTNWGGVADVRAIPDAFDLTMTTRALEPHADNPYREPVPGYVFLHCLVNDVAGGELLLTDGFQAAAKLRESSPGEFEALTRVRPDFIYIDEDTVLENSGPLIELDPQGRVRQLRLSNRTETVAAEDPELLDRYYRARRRLAELARDPGLQRRFRLAPGDLVIMDNHRMLHGRSAYSQDNPRGGYRHMRQCYMDRDTVGSRRKVLARRLGP